ncbi:MAG: hypothetical protein Q9227_009407 [Pyrenula ochraceoflavens]
MAEILTTTPIPPFIHERTHLRTRTEPILSSPTPSLPPLPQLASGKSQSRVIRRNSDFATNARKTRTASDNLTSEQKTFYELKSTLTAIPVLKAQSQDSPFASASQPSDFEAFQSTKDSSSLDRPRTSASCNESRLRRPPASHSSYGIETSDGPPPSFSTQRTFSQDRLWKSPTPDSLTTSPSAKQNSTASRQPNAWEPLDPLPPTAGAVPLLNSPETTYAASTVARTVYKNNGIGDIQPFGMDVEDKDRTIRELDFSAGDEDARVSSGEDRKSDDIFVKIASSDSNRPSSRSEKRRVSERPFFANYLHTDQTGCQSVKAESRSGLPVSVPLSSRYRERPPGDSISPRSQTFPVTDQLPSTTPDVPAFSSKRSSLVHEYSPASAHPLDDSARSRYYHNSRPVSRSNVGRDTRDTPSLLSGTGRRLSNADRTYRPPNTSNLRSTRVLSGTEVSDRPKTSELDRPRIEGTESTISTTAPSTVWDELDDLKSRIKKLELTGKLPSSSAAAMSNTSAERPRTATTTVTTLSSSPKHLMKKNSSPVETSTGGVPSSIHPLLHEALAKARPVVSTDVYQRLEATAADALQLASTLGGTVNMASGTSTVTGSSSIDRQLRRRGDSMCRGLTELAIALASEASPQVVPQVRSPSSQDRVTVEDPSQTISRVQSRLENRRRSLMAGSVPESPRLASPETAINSPTTRPTSSGRLNRTSLLRSRRGEGAFEGQDDEEGSPSIRPVSRAMTELTGPHLVSRSSPRERNFSREYTSQHPLPLREQQDSSVRKLNGTSPSTFSATANSNIPARRTVGSSGVATAAVQNPATPSYQHKAGLRRYGGASVEKAATMDSMDSTPESGGTRLNRSGQRRSLGLGSRLSGLGSTVGSRLRAARAERHQGHIEAPLRDGEITALPQQF